MHARTASLGAVLALSVAACGAAADDSAPPGAESDLIHGKDAVIADVPSTIRIASGCTAAKVAPRIVLTAAHCVLNLTTLEPRFGPDKPVKLLTDPAVGPVDRAVAKLHVHPEWMKRCADTICSISAVTAKLDAPDVALIELAKDLEGVPSAAIEPRPVAPGDKVRIVGFGCTKGVHLEDDRAQVTLAVGDETIVPPTAALHEGSFVTEKDAPVYSGNYTFTAGPGADEVHAGLCPGDSGGPLYALRENKLVVVGVNANYTLHPDDQDEVGLPITNWHTRLDRDSRHKVFAWADEIIRAAQAAAPGGAPP